MFSSNDQRLQQQETAGWRAERSRRRKAREVFDMFDADGSHTISTSEMKVRGASRIHGTALEYFPNVTSFGASAVFHLAPVDVNISSTINCCESNSEPIFSLRIDAADAEGSAVVGSRANKN